QNELQASLQYLQQLAQQFKPEFLQQLSGILSNITNDAVIRMAAALQLKKALQVFTSDNLEVQRQYQQSWLLFAEDVRNYIKQNVLNSLVLDNSRPSSAAQCVAYIAVAELPHSLWPTLIQTLTQNVTNPNNTEMMKESTLEAIGYICRDIDPKHLVSQKDNILTAIVHGMRKETATRVMLAATNALHNSLQFTKANFDKDSERHYIIQVVCEGTQCPEIKVKVAALQCLVKTMSLYYQHMEQYMGPALFAITMQAMRSDNDEIALQGIEFWWTACFHEKIIYHKIEQRSPKSAIFSVKNAVQDLVPILVQTLTKRNRLSRRASDCLGVMASHTGIQDSIISHVLSFVTTNITNADWEFRYAAVMAFGCILEVPDQQTLRTEVNKALQTLIDLMDDQSVIVRDAVVWTIGRICELIPEAVLKDGTLRSLLEALLKELCSEPRVAVNVCWALKSLAKASYEAVQKGDGNEPKIYCLYESFKTIVQKLLEATERQDGGQANLRSAAYEALMEMIKNSPLDCYPIVQKTTMIILKRMNHVLSIEKHISNRENHMQYNSIIQYQFRDTQSLLCATLQSVLRLKMTADDAPRISDAIMTALLEMFNASVKSGGVQKYGLKTVGSVVETLGEDFLNYMDVFRPFLIVGLRDHFEYQVCSAAVGLVGDICRAIGVKVLPFCDELMTVLLENLSNQTVHRSVKLQILSVFGDIALAISTEFKKHLDAVLDSLKHVSQLNLTLDYELSAAVGPVLRAFGENQSILAMLIDGKKSGDMDTQALYGWAIKEIRNTKII
ncbi:unnamed protein product, partial [Oppiella nova]